MGDCFGVRGNVLLPHAGQSEARPSVAERMANAAGPARPPNLCMPLADHHAVLAAGSRWGAARANASGKPRASLLCRWRWSELEADGTRPRWFLSAPAPSRLPRRSNNTGATLKQGSRMSRCRRSERWVVCAIELECMGRLQDNNMCTIMRYFDTHRCRALVCIRHSHNTRTHARRHRPLWYIG